MSAKSDLQDSAPEKRFIGQPIAMLETSTGGDPLRFRYRKEEHCVVEILDQWQDYGYSPAATKRNWRNRRHRNYYKLLTDKGLYALIYFDRGIKPESPRQWTMLEQYL
ncbi:MAG TPA: DUF6504 family protein [bacterium]|jgi:hypothetical protein